MSTSIKNKPQVLIDARGPRYTAAITSVVLAAALVTESNLIIGFQFAVFLTAVLFGLRRSIYGFIYRNLIQPRLSGPVPSDALAGGLTGNSAVFLIATSFALGAAFLNAAFGFCLGCQFYLLLIRAKSRIALKK